MPPYFTPRVSALIALLVLGAGCVTRTGDAPEASAAQVARLIEADRARAAAMVAVNRHELDARLHPELRYTHSTGSVDTRESLIATLEAGGIDYRKIESSAPTTRLFGETGVVAGPVTMSIFFEGRMIEVQSVYTAVYRRTSQGVWRLLAYQSTSSPN